MVKNKYSLVILSFFLLSIIFSITNIQGTTTTPIKEELATNVIHDGAPAFNWNLKEVISDIDRTFSSFAGKVVLIDFFATWCVPCRDAMPLLEQIKDHFFFDSRFVLMSIDVDTSESEAQVEQFADTYDMSWLIFRDTVNMDVYYDIEFIPTLVIINPSQFVAYSEIGMSSVNNIISIIDVLLAENDTANPLIASPEASETSLSVKNSDVTVSATITDDNLRYVQYKITIGDSVTYQEVYTPADDLIEFDFELDPTVIWDEMDKGATNATIQFIARDFSKNEGLETIVLPLDTIEDLSAPVISLDSIKVNALGDAEVIVSVVDDTAVKNVTVEAYSEGIKIAEAEMTNSEFDLWEATFEAEDIEGFMEIEFRVKAYDVSGKATVNAIDHTFGAGTTFTTVLAIVFLSGIIIVPLSRYFSKKKGT